MSLNPTRYRLYREHKYIFYVFSKLLLDVATIDFTDLNALTGLKKELSSLSLLLELHAQYEEDRIHLILKNNNSPLFETAHIQHNNQKSTLQTLNQIINYISGLTDQEKMHFLGYEFYLQLRQFFGENLEHFDYEEKVLMPELQRLVSDDELKEVDRISYQQMSPEQMIHMMEVLFPHMNNDDRWTFISEIRNCQPQHFEKIWYGISSIISEKERNELCQRFSSSESEYMILQRVQNG